MQPLPRFSHYHGASPAGLTVVGALEERPFDQFCLIEELDRHMITLAPLREGVDPETVQTPAENGRRQVKMDFVLIQF